MEFHDRLPRLVRRLGGDLYGVADLSLARAEVVRQGGEELSAYPRAVSIGVELLHPSWTDCPTGSSGPWRWSTAPTPMTS